MAAALHRKAPNRLHHTAYVSKDLEATRRFYEELIGLPLVATWCEAEPIMGDVRAYCHAFFELGDGSALAFFQLADPEKDAPLAPQMPSSPFHHIALECSAETQSEIRARLRAAGYGEDRAFMLDHGYVQSLYVTDPNGMLLELTVDSPQLDRIRTAQSASAHAELARWLAGDHRTNNVYR
jgi:glyoxylase I family protein